MSTVILGIDLGKNKLQRRRTGRTRYIVVKRVAEPSHGHVAGGTGHEVRLMTAMPRRSPSGDPTHMRFVELKSEEQLGVQTLAARAL